MLRLSLIFAFVLAFALSVASAPTPLVTAAPAPLLEERDVLEERAQKKKTTKKVAKKTTAKKSAPTNKLYVSSSSFTGRGTWFTQNGQPGSCGKWSNGELPLSLAKFAKIFELTLSSSLLPTPLLHLLTLSYSLRPSPRLSLRHRAPFALKSTFQ